ncbi:MAG: FoF1 ATP synthase subunit delta/epsilon [Pirellulaceae bacterium]
MSQLTCIVVTPEETALETPADFVALPLFDGEIGLAANHAPMIGRLGFGEMRVKLGDKVIRYYLDGGFVQVSGNIVSVLTNRAIPAAQVDTQAAQLQLDKARALPILTSEQEEIRDRELAQARGQLWVSRRA